MATGQRNTYTDTTPIMRAIATTIKNIDRAEAPLLSKLGLNNESNFQLINWPNTKVEWLEDTLSPRSGTLNEALDDNETGVDVQTGEGSYLKKGDVILVESELMWVASVSTDTATVTRGFAGSTAATHADDTAWEIVGMAAVEGSQYVAGHTTVVTAPYNYVQQFKEAFTISNDELINPAYGMSDKVAYHIAKLIGGGGIGPRTKAGKLPILLEKSFYHGGRAIGSATAARSMGGFNTFVTTNVTNLSSAALTLKHVEDKMQSCSEAGGSPDTIVCGGWVRRKLSSFYGDSIRTTRDESTGGYSIDTVKTDFGEVEIMYDKWCPSTELYIIESGKMGWVTFRPFEVVDVSTDVDGVIKDVRGSFSFVLQNEKAHARLYGISTSA
jgi:hypothetical protein